MCTYAVTTVSFNQTTYTVDENNGPVHPVIVLSKPLLADITVEVGELSDTATGKLCYMWVHIRTVCTYVHAYVYAIQIVCGEKVLQMDEVLLTC